MKPGRLRPACEPAACEDCKAGRYHPGQLRFRVWAADHPAQVEGVKAIDRYWAAQMAAHGFALADREDFATPDGFMVTRGLVA